MSEAVYDPILGQHGSQCQCDLCQRFRAGDDITKEPSQQEPYYTTDSLVSKQKDRIKELVDAHWSYMEKVLSTGQDKQQTFTWDQMMEIRKWDYTSSAIHFYGHGYEDAVNNQHQRMMPRTATIEIGNRKKIHAERY